MCKAQHVFGHIKRILLKYKYNKISEKRDFINFYYMYFFHTKTLIHDKEKTIKKKHSLPHKKF